MLLSIVMCVILVFLTVEQVIARYFFDASSIGLQELQWHLFGAMFLLSIPPTLSKNGHVRVDLIYGKLSEKHRTIIDVIGIVFFLIPTSLVILIYGWKDMMMARSFVSPVAADHYSALWFERESILYNLFAGIEGIIRHFVLFGETSPDPGGLGGRWVLKSLIPGCGVLLLLQSMASLFNFYNVWRELGSRNEL